MKVKICGITKDKEIEYLNQEKADYAGFVIFDKSKRYITTARAKKLMSKLDSSIKKVAVVVSPDLKLLKEIERCNFDIIQIHGDMSAEIIREAKIDIWRAFNVTNAREIAAELEIIRNCDKIKAIVVDGEKYGSGKTFDWSAGASIKLLPDDKLFVLAGGLNLSNVAVGIEYFKPDIVDVSSGVEGSDGKDLSLIRDFIKAANSRLTN